MVAVGAYMGGTRCSDVLSSTGDVLVRGVGGVCDMCMCLARGGIMYNVVSNECTEPTSCNLSVPTAVKLCVLALGVSLVS